MVAKLDLWEYWTADMMVSSKVVLMVDTMELRSVGWSESEKVSHLVQSSAGQRVHNLVALLVLGLDIQMALPLEHQLVAKTAGL